MQCGSIGFFCLCDNVSTQIWAEMSFLIEACAVALKLVG